MTSDGRLATDLYVAAHIRIAARESVPIMVLRRGDASSGTLILKINLLNGTARILIEINDGEKRFWTPATTTDPMPDHEADAYLAHQADIDPDAWLIEIEDKQGRVWFPGKVVAV